MTESRRRLYFAYLFRRLYVMLRVHRVVLYKLIAKFPLPLNIYAPRTALHDCTEALPTISLIKQC